MINVAFPDYPADRAAGKRTLVVLLGPQRAAQLFTCALIGGYASAWLTLRWSWPALLAQAAALPFGVLSLGYCGAVVIGSRSGSGSIPF